MVDNYHQHHLFIIVTEAEHLRNTIDTRITKITDLAAIVDIPADHLATTDLTVTINFKADTITEKITIADQKAITETIIIIPIQTPEIAATAITEVIVIIDHIIIITIITAHTIIKIIIIMIIIIIIIIIEITTCHETFHEIVHDHHINRDHLLIKK